MKLKSFRRIKTNKNALVATIITANIILIGISRFTYIIVDKYFDREGSFLGFKWLSTAFWNTGIEIFTINIGLLMYYGTMFMDQRVVSMFRWISFFLVAIGFFFLSWILFDDTGITNSLEILFSIITGVLAARIAISMYRFVLAYTNGLKFSIKELLHLLVKGIPDNYLDKTMTDRYDKEVVWPTLKKINDAT